MTGGAPDDERTIFRPTPLQDMRSREAAGRSAAHPAETSLGGAHPHGGHADSGDEDFPVPPRLTSPRNAMVEAAAPLLALVAAVRSGRLRIELPRLHQMATAAAARFDEALAGAGYEAEQRRRARYAVYATVDDVAQNLPGKAADGAEWARRSMVVRGFGENIGGDRFWMLLQEMLSRPSEYRELIELYHACLAAGFEGRHRISADGRNTLRTILMSAYAALPHVRDLSAVELVSGWRGHATPRRRVGPWAPLTLAASIALGLLLLLFLGFRLVLMETGEPSRAALAAINPDAPLRLGRAVTPAAPPASAQQDRVSAFLADEIARKLVVVEQDPTSLRVRTTVGQLFRSGSDALAPDRRPLFERIAAAVAREKGSVRIEGHADSDPVSSLTFPDNQALSAARAESVARIFRQILADPARVGAQGYGSTQPIAPNATAAGKALNRRVEIVVPRSE